MAVCMQTELKRWLNEFHLTANKSYTGSLEYFKTLTNVTLSSVIYNRGIFPKKSYYLEKLNGEIIPMLKPKSDCREANIFHSWMMGFHDAIDKKYLQTVILSLFDSKQPNIPIEEAKITIKYNLDEVTFEMPDETSSVREDTLKFIKASSAVAKGFGQFPKNYQMSMKLIYYTDVTPPDYEPPGYSAGGRDDEPEECDWQRILIGDLATPCHKMRMISSKLPPFRSQSPEPEAPSGEISNVECGVPTHLENELETLGQEPNNSPTYDIPETPMTLCDGGVDHLFADDNLFNVQDDIESNATKSSKAVGETMHTHETGDVDLQCPCGKLFFEDTIQCQSCKKFQHSTCFGLLVPVDLPEHCCDKCAMKDPRLTCTDPKFITELKEYKKETCLFRNALAVCNKHPSISLDILRQNLRVSRKTAVHIINELEKCNLFYSTSINPEDITHPRLINHTVLKTNILPRYFSNLHVSREKGAYLDSMSLDRNIVEEPNDTPNILSQKDMDYYNPELDASFCEEVSALQINTIRPTSRQSIRRKREIERFTPEKIFSHKRRKVESSKKLSLKGCNKK